MFQSDSSCYAGAALPKFEALNPCGDGENVAVFKFLPIWGQGAACTGVIGHVPFSFIRKSGGRFRDKKHAEALFETSLHAGGQSSSASRQPALATYLRLGAGILGVV